jgi:hypothetical protein
MRKNDPALFREIAALREVQASAAKMVAARAEREFREASEARDEQAGRIEATVAAWQASLSSSFSPESLRSWLAECGTLRRHLEIAERALTSATSERDRLKAEHQVSERRRDLADDLAARAHKDEAVRRDELRLQQAAELHLQRRARS